MDQAGADASRVAPAPSAPPVSSSPGALRREILIRLRRDGASTPDQLAVAIGASRTGVLQQLRALEATNFVSRQTIRHGVGRPRHLYDLTGDAQELFPSNYDGLAAGLLSAIGAVGGQELIEQVFQARRRQIGDRVRRELEERIGADAPLTERVRALAVIQDEQGYLADAVLALPRPSLLVGRHIDIRVRLLRLHSNALPQAGDPDAARCRPASRVGRCPERREECASRGRPALLRTFG